MFEGIMVRIDGNTLRIPIRRREIQNNNSNNNVNNNTLPFTNYLSGTRTHKIQQHVNNKTHLWWHCDFELIEICSKSRERTYNSKTNKNILIHLLHITGWGARPCIQSNKNPELRYVQADTLHSLQIVDVQESQKMWRSCVNRDMVNPCGLSKTLVRS